MPRTSSTSIRRPGEELAALRTALEGPDRYRDLCLVFIRRDTGEMLFEVGGVWDELERRYTGARPRTCRIVRVNDSQLDIALYFRDWLGRFRRGEARDRVLMLGGNRRGGKTFILVALVVALALEVPGGVTWIVSPTIERREEIDRIIGDKNKLGIPRSWFQYKASPEFKYYLPTGSTIRNLSGAVPGALKRGGALAVLLNEPQEMPPKTAAFAVPAIIDVGGLTMMAANPPSLGSRGEWTIRFRKKLLAKKIRGTFFDVDAAGNQAIDQVARADVADIVAAIDPAVAQADADAAWIDISPRAYPKFSEDLVQVIPDVGLTDVTEQFLARRIGRAYQYLAGADFQGSPHQAAVFFKLFAGTFRLQLEGVAVEVVGTLDAPLYFAIEELILEQATEDDLLDEVWARGYRPETCLFIGDASGQWQDAPHNANEPASFKRFRLRRYHILPPQKKRSERGKFSKNPDVPERLGHVLGLMARPRLFIEGRRGDKGNEPLLPWLTTSFAECPLVESRRAKGRVPEGKHAHVTDAGTYALFWAEGDVRSSKAPGTGGAASVEIPREKKWF